MLAACVVPRPCNKQQRLRVYQPGARGLMHVVITRGGRERDYPVGYL